MQGQVGADLGMWPRGLLMYPGGGLGVSSAYPLFAAQPTRPSATEGEGQGTTQAPRGGSHPHRTLWRPRNEGRMPLSSTLPS